MTASCPSVRQAAGDDDDGTGAQRAGLVRRRMEVFDQAQPLSAVHAAAIDSTQRRRRRSSIPKEQIYMLFSCCRRATSNTVVSQSVAAHKHVVLARFHSELPACFATRASHPEVNLYQLTVTSVCSRRVVERDAANTKQT